MTKYRFFALLALTVIAMPSQAAMPWHHPLYLANGGYWPHRVAVRVENGADTVVAGEPVEAALSALAGERVESLRVCTPGGEELLFDVRDAAGQSKRAGVLAATDRLLIPAECGPRGSTTVFVYAGNDAALPVPDFLAFGLLNGNFEAGAGRPDHWISGSADEQHVVSFEKGGGRNGSRGVKVEVAAGAAPTWVQWNQAGIPVSPGHRYQVTGWVRAENVVGQAGWYVHVNGDRPQLVNQTLSAGSGTFDWKQVTTTFTAPPTAVNLTVGTLLHGTGRAWFDDATFVELDGRTKLRASAGPLETLQLAPTPAGQSRFSADWPYRAVVRALNLTDAAAKQALVFVDLRAALGRLRHLPPNAVLQVIDPATGQPVESTVRLDQGLLFTALLPPRSGREFHVYFSASQPESASAFAARYEALLNSPANLVSNGSFERGAAMPEVWQAPPPGRQITAGPSNDARFGKRSVGLTVPATEKADWVGWRSPEIPVRPGATYYYGGFLKTKGVDGAASLHAHLHTRTGKMTASSAFNSTHPVASGDSAWSNSSTFIHTPADAASIQLHLTMNAHGTLQHDGILFCEVLSGDVVRLESAESAAASAGLRVWQVNPLVKVFPDDPPGQAAASLSLECARNEYEPLQWVLRSGKPLKAVDISVSPLANRAGARLPAVKVERVGFVPIDHPSGYFQSDVPMWYRKVPHGSGSTDGWAGEWPDPLIPGAAFDLKANRAQPIWITVHVPKNASPGDYQGEVTIRAEGAPALKIPLHVKVLPFALPDRTRLNVIFDFRSGPGGEMGSEMRTDTGRRRWLRFLAEHRIAINDIEPAPKFTYRDGKVTMDAAGFDETARYCFDELGMNVAYTPNFFYAFGWAYPPKKYFGLEPFTPEYNAAFKQAYRLFSDHLKQKGWHNKIVYYISDEPHFNHPQVVEQMKNLCALAHEVDPAIPIYSSTWRHCADWDRSLDLWGVGQYGCFPVPEIESLQRAGSKFWFTCDGQMATDTPYLATERMLPYYCFKYGVLGFEFWGLSWWTYNPWERGWHWFIRQSDDGKRHYWVRYPNGDGFLAYPGQFVGVDGPVSTIRLEQVREGLEDHEALAMLQEAAAKAKQAGRSVAAAERALAMARDLVTIPNAGGLRSTQILPDPDRIPAIRRAVNAALVALLPLP